MFHIICFYDYVPKSVKTYSCAAEVCRSLSTHLKSRTLLLYVLIISDSETYGVGIFEICLSYSALTCMTEFEICLILSFLHNVGSTLWYSCSDVNEKVLSEESFIWGQMSEYGWATYRFWSRKIHYSHHWDTEIIWMQPLIC